MAVKVSDKFGSLKENIRKAIKTAKRRNPLILNKTSDGITFSWETYSYNPTETHNNVWLGVVDGENVEEMLKVEKHGDKMFLEYETNNETKFSTITSKPLRMNGAQIYFTKHGFKGTMALNRDTLLGGDLYNPSSSRETKRKIRKDIIDNNKHDILGDIDSKKLNVSDDGKHYLIKDNVVGDVETLHGSKATQHEMMDSNIISKLLKIRSTNKKQVVMYLLLGVGAGLYLYPYVMK